MDLKNSFDLPVGADAAYRRLLDLPRVVPCLPGAKVTQDCGAGRCLGEIDVRLGPVMLRFAGSAEIVAANHEARTANLKAEGQDEKGRGGAAATMTFTVSPADAGSHVTVATQLTLSGSVAQYGRGSAMIADLANMLVSAFALNLKNTIAASPEPAVTDAVPPPTKPLDGGRLAFRMVWKTIQRLIAALFGRRL